jgi:hypothetical protein
MEKTKKRVDYKKVSEALTKLIDSKNETIKKLTKIKIKEASESLNKSLGLFDEIRNLRQKNGELIVGTMLMGATIIFLLIILMLK